MDLSTIKTQKACEKERGLWIGNICRPKTLKTLQSLPLDTLCKTIKGASFKKSEMLELGDKGFQTAIVALCDARFVHISNERDHTIWAPVNPDIETSNGWSIIPLANQCHGCAKNDNEKVLGKEEEQRREFINNFNEDDFEEIKLTKAREKLFMNGDDSELEEIFRRRIDGDMESVCEDAWEDLNKTAKDGWKGDWRGDNHDNYDISDIEDLFANENGMVYKEMEHAESSEEATFTMIKWSAPFTLMRPSGLDDNFRDCLALISDILDRSESNEKIGRMQIFQGWQGKMKLELEEVQFK